MRRRAITLFEARRVGTRKKSRVGENV